MMPIHELLNRIRWDRQFGQGEFTIGYYDRLAHDLIEVPLREIRFEPEDHFSFGLIDSDGVPHSIPLHRIREVHKNGRLIWQRPH